MFNIPLKVNVSTDVDQTIGSEMQLISVLSNLVAMKMVSRCFTDPPRAVELDAYTYCIYMMQTGVEDTR